MRIRDLFEGKYFNEQDYITHDDNGRNINFDLDEDLIYFMNNDDHAYRRHFFPELVQCVEHIKAGKKYNSANLSPAVKECYGMYVKKFPIRDLPDQLDEEQLKQICEKIKDEVETHIEEGKYKD